MKRKVSFSLNSARLTAVPQYLCQQISYRYHATCRTCSYRQDLRLKNELRSTSTAKTYFIRGSCSDNSSTDLRGSLAAVAERFFNAIEASDISTVYNYLAAGAEIWHNTDKLVVGSETIRDKYTGWHAHKDLQCHVREQAH